VCDANGQINKDAYLILVGRDDEKDSLRAVEMR
jgi:hypothetical protein